MPSYLLDTSVLIDHLRGRQDVVERVAEIARDGHLLCCCAINVVEVFSGMREHERTATENLLAGLHYFDIDYEAARLAGELRAELRQRGEKGGLQDTLIGAVALANDATLVTNNVKDFPIPGLRIEPLPARR